VKASFEWAQELMALIRDLGAVEAAVARAVGVVPVMFGIASLNGCVSDFGSLTGISCRIDILVLDGGGVEVVDVEVALAAADLVGSYMVARAARPHDVTLRVTLTSTFTSELWFLR
jgi:hypothetical protein